MDNSVSRGRGSRKQATTVAPSWPRDLETEGERGSTNKDELEEGERMVSLCKDLLHHALVQLFRCNRKHRVREETADKTYESNVAEKLIVCVHSHS